MDSSPRRPEWAADDEPSLIQRHQQLQDGGGEVCVVGLDAAERPLSKVGWQASVHARLSDICLSFVCSHCTQAKIATASLASHPNDPSAAAHDLLTLRSASHALSDEQKSEKQKVAAVKAKVDEARLQLENRRLEERELMEEIRRESGE